MASGACRGQLKGICAGLGCAGRAAVEAWAKMVVLGLVGLSALATHATGLPLGSEL